MSTYKFCLSCCAALMLVACAAPPKPIAAQDIPVWSGRIAIKVASDPVQHVSAGFTLQGSEAAGQLALFTPLGSKAAEIVWQNPPIATAQAVVTTGKGVQTYPSINAALAQITGADIPVAALFEWLKGNPTNASQGLSVWKADLTRFDDGRITAVREQPLPQIELRVVLER